MVIFYIETHVFAYIFEEKGLRKNVKNTMIFQREREREREFEVFL